MAKVGTGQFVYEVVERWGNLPTGMNFGVVVGVATDSQGRVYMCQQRPSIHDTTISPSSDENDPPVIVFDREGNYLSSWGAGFIVEPHSIYISPDDIIYLADRGAHVALKMTLDGQPLLELGNRGQPSDTGCNEDEGEVLRAGVPFNRPTQMFPAPSGDLFVSDGYRNCRLHRFSSEGKLISSLGTPGGTPGEFRVPHSCWVDKDGRVYVVDRRNNRIQIFSAAVEFITQWPDLYLPGDIYIDASENVYVYEGGAYDAGTRISVMDKQGKLQARWDAPLGHEIWVDSKGDVLLTVPFEKRIVKYVRQR